MNREEFIEAISGFEAQPIRLRTAEGWSEPVIYSEAYSDTVRLLADERPLLIRYAEILELRFPVQTPCPAAQGEIYGLLGAQADQPFYVQTAQGWSPMLRYWAEQGGFLAAEADGRPYFVRTDRIETISFSAPESRQPVVRSASAPLTGWAALRDAANRLIKSGPWQREDRRDDIRERVKGTPLENAWARIDDMVRSAVKANAMEDKADRIITELDDLFHDYPCAEVKLMLADVFAKAGDYDNASLEYEEAGDYVNAAYYAHCCEERGYGYGHSVYAKWIARDRGKKLPLSVYCNYFRLSQMLHKGRACAELTAPDLQTDNSALQDILFSGLLLVLSDYLPEDQLPPLDGLDRRGRIAALHRALVKASAGEETQHTAPKRLKTIAQLTRHTEPAEELVTRLTPNGDDTYTGYIILFGYNLAFGFIGPTPDSRRGIFFKVSELEPQLQAYRTELLTLKVTCRLVTVVYNGKEQQNAAAVTAAEDLGSFLRAKGLPYHEPGAEPPVIPDPAELTDEDPECTLAPDADGESLTGYIVRMSGQFNFGYLADRPDAEKGILFLAGDLAPELQEFRCRLNGMRVSCRLSDTLPDGTAHRHAVSIAAAEDLEAFLMQHAKPAQDSANNSE